MHDHPKWLEEFTDNLEDEEEPALANISHGSDPERPKRVHERSTVSKPTSRKTKILRSASGPRLQGLHAECELVNPAPRAVKFGDMITADHKVLNEGRESRNYHRYSVVVQDLATQRIQSYPCKTRTSQETQRSLQKFLEPNRKPKVIYTDNSLEFGKACEDLSKNHRTSSTHRSETMELLKDYYFDLAWMKDAGPILWNAIAICEMSKTSRQTGTHLMKDDSEHHSKVHQ